MKIDQKINLAYFILGIALGLLTNFLFNLIEPAFALILSLVLYGVSLPILFVLVKEKKKSWLFYNSFITFFLTWVVVWVVMYNL